ncbi:hypothetical protein V5O48_001551 [Marasmius crinis-equi]|uniref:Uncharacterized protein n=1 Tax=Marasmius crinis-equi TaxID=585013 RepID=A0ABR3FYN9_9AGAR
MGRALFSQSLAVPAIHEDTGYAAENPTEKAGYDRWSITNPFDPDSEEFFSNAQTERFLEPEELTEQQVLISSSVPPSDTDPNLLPPNAGPPVTNWVSVGPNMWARTVRRVYPLPTQPVPSQMQPLDSPSSSGTTTPRSASPQTPDPTYSPTIPGLVPSEGLLARLPPPATTTTITPTTPSLSGAAQRRRLLDNSGDSIPMSTPSPPPSLSPRMYSWARSRPEDNDSQQSSSSRRIRPRLDTGAGAPAQIPSRHSRRARTRSLGAPHQHPESLIPGMGTWHERNPYHGFHTHSADSGAGRDEGGRVGSQDSARTAGLENDSMVALLRRVLERTDRTRDLDGYLERLTRDRAFFQDRGDREGIMDVHATQPEEEPEPFIPEPEALRFVAL